MKDDIRLGRVLGFPLAMNWSVLVIVWLLVWGLADGSLPHAAPGHTTATYWAAALVAAALFFASLLGHELAHAVVARRAGIEVKALTLWLFGGVAQLGGEPDSPRDDLRIALAGPGTSLALAAGFGAAAAALSATGTPHIAVAVTAWLAGINAMLGAFNLIPGAPLDGGRVLRALLWRRHGDRVRAAVTAARSGRVVGYGLIGLGLLEFAGGAGGSGLWLAFIGWFLLTAAKEEEAATMTRSVLRGVTVGDIMTPHPATAPGWITIDDFVDRYLLSRPHSAYPVEGFDGGIVGLVTLNQLRAVTSSQRSALRVIDCAVPVGDVPSAAPSEALVDLLGRVADGTGGRALVFEGGALVGIVTPTDVARAVDARLILATPTHSR